jgi:hypothetical protein
VTPEPPGSAADTADLPIPLLADPEPEPEPDPVGTVVVDSPLESAEPTVPTRLDPPEEGSR